MLRRAPRVFALLLALVAGAPAVARAGATAVPADLVAPNTIKLDGLPKEWPSGMTVLGEKLTGDAGKPDLEARAVLAYDAEWLYVGADVADERLRGGADRVEVVIGFPGRVVHLLALYPGQPGKTAGSAKLDGRPIPTAKVVEAPTAEGWSLEAAVPWSSMPIAKTVRVGLRGAVVVRDADATTAIESAVGTSASVDYASLPALPTEPEQALRDGLLRDKGLHAPPRYNLLADVAGDPMKERVLVFDRYLVVLGPGFRGGSEYFWNDMGIDASGGMLPACEAVDVTGDGQAEIVFRKRFGTATRWREMMQIVTFAGGDVPRTIFQHEIGISTDAGTIANEVAFDKAGGKTTIVVTDGRSSSLTAERYHEKTEQAFDPLLLPWGTIESQTYAFVGSSFAKTDEKQRPAPEKAPSRSEPAAAPARPAPAAPSALELLQQVYATYKQDRGVSGRPRFELSADVEGDRQSERVVVHDRDLVVFGKTFKGGTGYSFMTLPFASSGDVRRVTTRDLTGDGLSEILVEGVQRATAPEGEVEREVLLVFQVAGAGLRRIFSAETGRAIGKSRVGGSVRFVPAARGQEIELAPGKATRFTQESYPFPQDTGPVGGFEPLLLPWSGQGPVRYRWNGTAFVR